MEKEIFNRIMKRLSDKSRSKINSSDPVDNEIFEIISRIYYENNNIYIKLKGLAKLNLSYKKPIAYLLMAYFHYIDCEFKEALACFKEFLKFNEDDLGATLNLAFCHRQLGNDKKFEEIISHVRNKTPSKIK